MDKTNLFFSTETTISTHLSEQLMFSIIQIGRCWERLSCNIPCHNLSLLNYFSCAGEGLLTIGKSKDNICPRPLIFRRERELQLLHW